MPAIGTNLRLCSINLKHASPSSPVSPNSSAGQYFSARSFGHTGFTGTSIWADLEKELLLVLLTNRVNPTRDNQKIGPLRRAVADVVQKSITDTPLRIWEEPLPPRR